MSRAPRIALAVVLTAVCAYAAVEEPPVGLREPLWLSWLAGILIGAPIAVGRRWPIGAATVVGLGSAGALASGVIPDYAGVAPAVALACALHTVGLSVRLRRSLIVLAGCLAGLVTALVPVADRFDEVGFVCGLTAAGWAVGRAVRQRRAAAARAAEQRTERAVSDERLRIARELHDIVGHSMSLIAVKASVANYVAEARPEEARDALRVIEATSRGALLEIRRALGALREETPYAPAPGLDDLAGLAGSAGGVTVELDVEGATLPDGVGLAVFRIVQESLTNVVKHAAPARCRVRVRVDPAEVRVEVTDDGRRSGGVLVAGHGLIGMRERVAVYGGELTAGPGPDGGFAVVARLPYVA